MTLVEYEKLAKAMGAEWMLKPNDKLGGRRPIDCTSGEVLLVAKSAIPPPKDKASG